MMGFMIREIKKRDAEIERLRDALEHATELLVDTWHTAMEGDPEREVAVADARALLVAHGW